MPAKKYSHTKKIVKIPLKTSSTNSTSATAPVVSHSKREHKIAPTTDHSISTRSDPLAILERSISRIILIRFDLDIARLFSAHLHKICITRLPELVVKCEAAASGGEGLAFDVGGEGVKDFLRSVVAMDLRQAGERVATKSVLWSYTALRHFVRTNIFYFILGAPDL